MVCKLMDLWASTELELSVIAEFFGELSDA
jgi:hypothetical protein